MKVVMIGASIEQNGGIATVEKLILKYMPPNIQIQHITSHDEGTIAHRCLVFGQAIVRLCMALLIGKAELVHIHLSDGGSALRKGIIAMIVQAFHKPVIIHAHGAEFHSTFFRLPRWAQSLLGGIFRQCHSFIVLSENWNDFYRRHLRLTDKQMLVLPNPTEIPQDIPHRPQSSRIYFAFLGRVGNRKGTFDLIRAFAHLPAVMQEQSHLLIAGDGDLEKARSLVEQHCIADHVTFLGWVDAEKREKILATADVFVLPSYNEGLPMALLEAMGWGLPAIVTPVGGIPEVIQSQQNGLLVEAGDVVGLTAAMQTLIEQPHVRSTLGRAARATVAPYDIHFYCDRLAALYETLTQFNEP